MENFNSSYFYKALESQHRGQIDEARAVLHTYFTNSVGVGEHSELLKDFNKWLEVINRAEESLVNLKKHFGGGA